MWIGNTDQLTVFVEDSEAIDTPPMVHMTLHPDRKKDHAITVNNLTKPIGIKGKVKFKLKASCEHLTLFRLFIVEMFWSV